MHNQKEISQYQALATDSLNCLANIPKDLFDEKELPLPNYKWIEEAKDEMEGLLKEEFEGKMPPWIHKIIRMFWKVYREKVSSNQRECSMQTEESSQAEVYELRKKNIRSMRRIDEFEQYSRNQDKEVMGLENEKEIL